MKERIKQIMELEDMTPARFADTLQINRAVISHILNGRNNPSLDVISRILSEMPKVNADWLISGNGSMYKESNESFSTPSSDKLDSSLFQPDLFAQNYTEAPNTTDEKKYEQEKELIAIQSTIQSLVNERIIYEKAPEKKIERIIIYYTDNTYETFNPEK